MTANTSIDPARFLHDQLETASPDLLRDMLTTFINALMNGEADAICGAPYGQPSIDRTNQRNGYRHRDFDTRAGTLDVAIPKLRSGSYFPDWLLERQRRAERALTTVVATCYLLGVSTRRMENLVETLGITRLSKSQVSVMARELDEAVAQFRTRPLDAGPYTFVAADALVLKVREGGRVVNVHALVATGVNGDGHREILGLQVTSAADGAGWLAGFPARPDRAWPVRCPPCHQRRPRRPRRRDRRDPARRGLAALPHPLRRQPHVRHPENVLALGEDAAAFGLRPARQRRGARAVRPGPGHSCRQTPRGRRPPRGRPRRRPRVHRVPQRTVATDLVQQPTRTAESRDPPPHRCGRYLPRPQRPDPPRRRRPGRAARRLDRGPALPRPRRPRQGPPHHHHRHRHHHRTGDTQHRPQGTPRPGCPPGATAA